MRNKRITSKTVAPLFRAKERRRKKLARLPIEEKVRIIVELQTIENEIRRATGRPTKPEWDLRE